MGIPDPNRKPRKPPRKPSGKQVIFGPSSDWAANAAGTPAKDRVETRTPKQVNAAHQVVPASAPVRPVADPQVLSRQRTLRAAGYPIAVDGIWGPASQAAWSSYVRGVRPGTSGPLTAGGRQAGQAALAANQAAARAAFIRQQTAKAQAQARAARIKAASLAQRAAAEARTQAQMVSARAAVAKLHGLEPLNPALSQRLEAKTRQLQARPDLAPLQHRSLEAEAVAREIARSVKVAQVAFGKPAAKMTTDELVATTVDPLTGNLDPSKPDSVKRVQEWLQANGHPRVKVDGQWSKETNAALMSTFQRLQREERARQVKEIATRFYSSGVVVPGKPLGPFAHAPKPGELLAILQRGGLDADALLRELRKRYLTSQPVFLHFQEQQLDSIERQLFPLFSADGALSKLGAVTPARRAAKLQVDAALAVERGEMSPEQAQAFVGQIGVLGSSRTLTELHRNVEALKLRLDQQHKNAMHAEMGDKKKVHGFWGHTLHAFGLLAIPAQYTASQIEASAIATYKNADDVIHWRAPAGAANHDAAEAAVLAWQRRHPWLEMGMEMVFDPLWMVKPLSIIGHGAEAVSVTAMRLERIGLTMEQGGRLARITAPAISRPAQTVRAFEEAGRGVTHFARGETATSRLLQLDHFYNATRKLTQTKQQAVQAVTRRIRAQRRVNFRELGTDLWGGNVVDGELRFALDQSAPKVRSALQRLTPAVLRHLSDSNLSLFTDIERTQDSVIGGQVRAHLMRQAQITIHQNLAIRQARRTFVNSFFGREIAKQIEHAGLDPIDYWQLRTGQRGFEDASEQAAYQQATFAIGAPEAVVSEAEALRHAQDAFKDILDRIDFRGFGGHDVELAETLGPLMDKAEQDIADTLALLQDHVEARAESMFTAAREAAAGTGKAAAHPLWDAEGKWVGRGSQVTRHLLTSADEGFGRTVSVANRAFGRGHTFDEMQMLRQLEHEAWVKSAIGTLARKGGEGMHRADDFLEQLGNEKLAELETAWKPREDGLYYDARETIEAPAHYASHLRSAFIHHPQIAEFLPDSLKAILSISNGPHVNSPFVGELNDLADAITSARSITGFNRRAAGGAWHDYVLRGTNTGPDVAALGGEFKNALIEHTSILDQAEKLVTPRELVREYALWAALAKAQSAPLRVAYKALSAFLDVWLVATLPLRPGFVVRNVVDNTAKMLADGAIDPRFYFPRTTKAIGSVFELGMNEMRAVLTLGGRFTNNPAVYYFDRLLDSFWNHESGVLRQIFHSHDIPVPQSALDKMRFGADEALDPAVVQSIRAVRNKLMYVMANLPENAAKRVLYRDTYFKALRRGATETEAFEEAIRRIDFVLFDYSHVSVLEDNLRFIFPFVQFWRKTATFWGVTAVKTPALPVEIDRFEQTLRDKANADLPDWMRRYVNLEPVAQTLSRVPGLDWLSAQLLDGMQTDPMNFFSFNVLYKTFKNENPDLPADHAGMKFIAPFVDALNDWGLSMNPLVRKPAEFAGVFNYRAWQSVFPETGLFDAISRQFFTNSPQGFNLEAILEDKVLGLIGYDLGARQRIENGFDQWVQLEMAAQAERGETVDRAKAVSKIQHYYVVQTILGFFSGMYARRRDDADVYLYKLAEGMHFGTVDYRNLSAKDKRAYDLFKRRKLDPIAFNAYVEAQPVIEAYYKLGGTHEQREAFKAAHPEIIPYIGGWKAANVAGKSFVETMPLLADTDTAISFLKILQNVDADFTVKQAARQMFVTPELEAFWARNDTPAQIRDKMLQGALHAHIGRLQDAYFAIPDTDHKAKQGFLDANPLLPHFWTLNDSASDDLKGVMNSMNATLRDRYFEYLDAKDYDGARAFLHRFPFIFEFTSAADKVNKDGDWISFGGGKAKSQHARDYLAAKQYLDHFFALMDSGQKKAAFAYLNATPQLRAYFARWGKGNHTVSQHAKDYLAIKSTLQWFFKLLKSDKARAQAWLDSDNPDAKKVRDYFRKYAHSKGMTQHGLDYVKVKDVMKRYFDLKDAGRKDDARAFLKKHPELEAYFKKYGHFTKTARKWKELIGSASPEINARLDFWKRYWTLPPDERPAFVAEHADDAGVFVYGSLSARKREEAQRDYLRQAVAHKGVTVKMALYLRIKPLLDLYYTLSTPSDKDLFLRANPEVQNYLDNYSDGPKTGDKKLDALIEAYFQLDRHSADRTDFLRRNPKLQAYFDRHSSPADLAMRHLLESYFKMPPGKQRSSYSAQHPEIQAYFDQRKAERDNELSQAMAFDMADPRLADYLDRATAESGHNAITMLRLLRESVARNRFKDDLSRRTERTPTVE